MDSDAIFARCADLRRDTAEFVESLDEQQLGTQSLCGQWDVRTVAAHLTLLITASKREFILAMLRSRGDFDRANDTLSTRRATAPVATTVKTLRERASSRAVPPGGGPKAPFTDLLVHNGDMRLPLGLPFEPDPADLAVALAFVAGAPRGFVAKNRLDGIRLAPDDVDGAWGSGGDLTGRGADILMLVSGRHSALDRVGGSGKDVLAARLLASRTR
ncbi:MAG: maleylpyruvate isomerase family mycothiol-dependent enzyme [Jatrophihabitans sp.]